MAKENCAHPDCGESASTFVGGKPMCRPHGLDALQQIVLGGPGQQTLPSWRRAVGRLIEATVPAEARGGLTPAKVECRTYSVKWESPVVEFSIQRHPAGFVYEQRWRFEASRGSLELLSESLVKSDFRLVADGQVLCPKCGSSEIERRPGVARCQDCGYAVLHEHSAQ